MKTKTKVRLIVYGSLLCALPAYVAYCAIMPGTSPPLGQRNAELARQLQTTVSTLVERFPTRNLSDEAKYRQAGAWLEAQLSERTGLSVTRQLVPCADGDAFNYSVSVPAKTPDHPLLVVGAHYDTAPNTQGADDNASGVALLLHLAAHFSSQPPGELALRFVLFANEEPPYFQNDCMGSRVAAADSRARGEQIRLMLSLESLGYYTDAEGSQKYPFPFGLVYPSQGNFVAFVGKIGQRSLVAQAVSAFRAVGKFPAEGGALPAFVPGIGWSDHWSYWQEDYPAVMVTDTAPFRSPHYHRPTDAPAELDYGAMSLVAEGLVAVLERQIRAIDD